MKSIKLLTSLCQRPDLANQLIGGAIASVRHMPTPVNGQMIPAKVAIMDHDLVVVSLFVKIEDRAAAEETYRLYDLGRIALRPGAIVNLSNGHTRLAVLGVTGERVGVEVTADPGGDRLRLSFRNEAMV
ncbi:hypothetical protein SAMN05216374_3180 [Tardiphaga sp. OK246]|uniref:hypothetical protein n=1 Tax=Tardiphaga sp. OK246 TaxID=1855307 RepID=UPI000B6C436D|nr:hypothetical protein [Tardiphaga sp. OK246]SNT32495.1 hypothetical protein SAMN05216374_3180 [Tardiphaga sp. OK246]